VIAERPAWMDDAACAGLDPGLFFPELGEEGDSVVQAKAVCETCPVQAECLEFSVVNFEKHGIWGGLTEKQRRRLRQGKESPRMTGAHWVQIERRLPRFGQGPRVGSWPEWEGRRE
jgi:WhiB family redox-sensing transcriptional regulator